MDCWLYHVERCPPSRSSSWHHCCSIVLDPLVLRLSISSSLKFYCIYRLIGHKSSTNNTLTLYRYKQRGIVFTHMYSREFETATRATSMCHQYHHHDFTVTKQQKQQPKAYMNRPSTILLPLSPTLRFLQDLWLLPGLYPASTDSKRFSYG